MKTNITPVTCELLNTERFCVRRVSVSVCSELCKLGHGWTRVSVEREEPRCNRANQQRVGMCLLQTKGQPISE